VEIGAGVEISGVTAAEGDGLSKSTAALAVDDSAGSEEPGVTLEQAEQI
jgi:hypothetical protein